MAIFTRMSSAEFAARAERAKRNSSGSFSISRLLGHMVNGSTVDGLEGEVMTELRRINGGGYDQFRMPIPIELLSDPTAKIDILTRDLNMGSADAGGYLVGTENAPVVELLRPWSVVAKAGVTTIPAPAGGSDLVIPRTTAGMTGYWLDSESADITQSDMTFDKDIKLQPKTVAAYGKYSRLLSKQTSIADGLLQRNMLMTLGLMLDTATLAGTGADGQPTGLLNIAGTQEATGAFNLDSALTMEQSSAEAVGGDEQFGYITTPAVRKLLKARTTDLLDAGELIWRSAPTGDTLAGRKAWAANYVNASTVISGPWPDCVVAMWGTPELIVNPYKNSNFRTGMVEVKMLLNCEVKFLHPAAWSKHTAVS